MLLEDRKGGTNFEKTTTSETFQIRNNWWHFFGQPRDMIKTAIPRQGRIGRPSPDRKFRLHLPPRTTEVQERKEINLNA